MTATTAIRTQTDHTAGGARTETAETSAFRRAVSANPPAQPAPGVRVNIFDLGVAPPLPQDLLSRGIRATADGIGHVVGEIFDIPEGTPASRQAPMLVHTLRQAGIEVSPEGDITLPNTRDGGRFLAAAVMEAHAPGDLSLAPGLYGLAKFRDPEVLRRAGFGEDFIAGFREQSDSFHNGALVSAGSVLLGLAGRVAAVRTNPPPMQIVDPNTRTIYNIPNNAGGRQRVDLSNSPGQTIDLTRRPDGSYGAAGNTGGLTTTRPGTLGTTGSSGAITNPGSTVPQTTLVPGTVTPNLSPGNTLGTGSNGALATGSRSNVPGGTFYGPGNADGVAQMQADVARRNAARTAEMDLLSSRTPVPSVSDGASTSVGRYAWDDAGRVAAAHNAGGNPLDLVVRVPVDRDYGGDNQRREVGLLRGDALGIENQVAAMKGQGSIPRDFDLAGQASQLGIDWDAARTASANHRALPVAVNNPITLNGGRTFAFGDATTAQNQAVAFNRNSSGADDVALYVPVSRTLDTGRTTATGVTHEVYVGSPAALRDTYRDMKRSGLVRDGASFDEALRRSGISGSLPGRAEAARDLIAAQDEVRFPTTLFGGTTGVTPNAGESQQMAVAHNRAAPDDGPWAISVPLLRDVSAPGLPADAKGTAHAVYANTPDNLRGFFDEMNRQGRIPPGVTFDGVLRDSGIAGRYANWEASRVTTGRVDGFDVPGAVVPTTPTPHLGGVVAAERRPIGPFADLAPLGRPDLSQPSAAADWVNERWADEIDALSPAEKERLATIVELGLADAGPDVEWTRPELIRARDTLRAAGARGITSDLPNPADPIAVAGYVRARGLEDWEGGLDHLTQDRKDAMARTLDAAIRADAPQTRWYADDMRNALDAVRAAGGRAFPEPVPPGHSDFGALPRATEYGLPSGDYTYVGADLAGNPVWRGADGRNVGPFSTEPTGAFANPAPVATPAPEKFPFNPTAPGAIVPAEPPGALAPFDPSLVPTPDAAIANLPPETRDRLDEVIGFVREELGIEARVGANVTLYDPIAGTPMARAAAGLGLDTIRYLNANAGEIVAAVRAGDFRAVADHFLTAIGTGARIGEVFHEPQVARYVLFEMFGVRGLGMNSAFQWKASSLEEMAERSFTGTGTPFRFEPDRASLTLDPNDPGFATIAGRLSLAVERLPRHADGTSPVDAFGSTTGQKYRLLHDLPIDKTMFEFYTPSLSRVDPATGETVEVMPSGEYREELASKLVIPAGTVLPAEMVEIFDRAVANERLTLRFQVPHAATPEAAARTRDLVAANLGNLGEIYPDFGVANVEAQFTDGMRRRMSAVPGKPNEGFRTLDANFLPAENFAHWVASIATGRRFEIAGARAIDGVLDPAARFAPDALHGFADKVRFKLNLGPEAELGDVAKISTAFYFLRESRPDMRTRLMRSNEEATISFTPDLGAARGVAVPTWLATMITSERAPGRLEATLGIGPLPPGGIVVPPGGADALRGFLQREWNEGTPREREAIAGFLSRTMGGPSPVIGDQRTLMPDTRDELVRLLYDLADPAVDTRPPGALPGGDPPFDPSPR